MRPIVSIAAALLAAGIGLGAFGAHALRDRFSEYQMMVYEKALFYHFLNSLGLLLVALLPKLNILNRSDTVRISAFLIFGIVVFSGSLYLLSITEKKWLGAITPIGGVSFIIGWTLLAIAALRSS